MYSGGEEATGGDAVDRPALGGLVDRQRAAALRLQRERARGRADDVHHVLGRADRQPARHEYRVAMWTEARAVRERRALDLDDASGCAAPASESLHVRDPRSGGRDCVPARADGSEKAARLPALPGRHGPKIGGGLFPRLAAPFPSHRPETSTFVDHMAVSLPICASLL